MYLVAGLGNPGGKFEDTRHNIGRVIVMAAGKKLEFKDFSPNARMQSLLVDGKIGKEKVILLAPETFMNKSGDALGPAARFLKVKPQNIVVIHDDVDMPLGAAKLSFGKNSGGHKGVESVMRALKSKKFWRMRIGVQKKKRVPGEDLVLQKFRGDEMLLVKKIIRKSLQALEDIAINGPERAMNEFNR